MGVVVAAHCFITFFLPVPNCPVGYIGPGGLHLDGQYPKECIGGAAGYIDRWLLTSDHIYNWPTAREVYDSGPYDPEGILGMLYHKVLFYFYNNIRSFVIISEYVAYGAYGKHTNL